MKKKSIPIIFAGLLCTPLLEGAEIFANHANAGIARYTPSFTQVYTPSNGEITGLSVTANSVFWAEVEHTGEGPVLHMKSSNHDGSELSVIHSFAGPEDTEVKIAVKNGKLYWANRNGIFQSELDGSDIAQIQIPDYFGAVDLKVTGTHIYWSYYSGGGSSTTGGAIYRCDLDGGRKATLFANIGSAFSIAVSNTKIYWLDIAADRVFSGNLDGSEVVDFQVHTRARAMTATGEGIYVENDVSGNPHIVRYDLDGSEQSTYVALNYSTTFGLESRFLSGTSDIQAAISPAHAIKFNSELGLNYFLESTETLGSDSWVVVAGPLKGTGAGMKFFAEADKAKEFYRVVSLPDQ